MGRNESLDLVFAALADPTRRAMIERLSVGECSVSDLWEPFDVSAPAISKHLRVLENAGLIVRVKEGRVTYCRLTGRLLETATQWLDKHRGFWEQQLDGLRAFVEEDPGWPSPQKRAASCSGSSAASRRRASASSKRGRRRRH
jgi:DNA-binding transcriptional ArsR family regulator